MREWVKLSKSDILNNKDLLNEFSQDFSREFGKVLNYKCGLCIDDAYIKLTLKDKKMKDKNTCEYILKGVYSGAIWKNQPIRRNEMTDELALDLIENHSLGVKLFESLPLKEIKDKSDNDLSLSELRDKYPTIKSNSKEAFLKKIELPLNDNEDLKDTSKEEE